MFSFVSIPVYSRIGNCTMDRVPYSTLMIRMNNPSDHATIDAICSELADVMPP